MKPTRRGQAVKDCLSPSILANRLGFTLFEVLMAMVVMTLTVTVFLGGMLGVLRFSEKINHRTELIARFEEFLFKLETAGYDENEIRFHGGGASDSPVYLFLDADHALHGVDFSRQSGRESEGQLFQVSALEGVFPHDRKGS